MGINIFRIIITTLTLLLLSPFTLAYQCSSRPTEDECGTHSSCNEIIYHKPECKSDTDCITGTNLANGGKVCAMKQIGIIIGSGKSMFDKIIENERFYECIDP